MQPRKLLPCTLSVLQDVSFHSLKQMLLYIANLKKKAMRSNRFSFIDQSLLIRADQAIQAASETDKHI